MIGGPNASVYGLCWAPETGQHQFRLLKQHHWLFHGRQVPSVQYRHLFVKEPRYDRFPATAWC
jgi:hypothetical protein